MMIPKTERKRWAWPADLNLLIIFFSLPGNCSSAQLNKRPYPIPSLRKDNTCSQSGKSGVVPFPFY